MIEFPRTAVRFRGNDGHGVRDTSMAAGKKKPPKRVAFS
jgi:hypothetical protein